MNDSPDNEAMLGRFRQWLEETRREADALPDDGGAFGGAGRRLGRWACCNWSRSSPPCGTR